ncbi:peptidoglycan-binding protein [Rhodobacteraceae bacterium N5(2021)]|uniref:Peptidoglycan-binding protein n=1 Tax=Gymnodinialimonas phycosphaerae TaxID=2841589 RepID=A0A975TSU3_9RHOB|nr:peptidoglycan-binding protein [Gymnodinialimonas phycosphaerae]MBY4893912.1 peptidoglycan-binding protein [Gymnodinialimonas phycosphaerae]
MSFRPLAMAAALFSGLAAQAAQADTALLMVNDRYPHAQNLRDARPVEELRARLLDAGFNVVVVSNGNGADLREGLSRLLQADEEERILIAAVGHFARSNTDSWLLGTQANEPSLATVGGDGISISVLMEVAASAPGRSIVMFGLERRRIDLGANLSAGVGRIDAPQGVTVLAGAPDDLADFTTNAILIPGTDLRQAVEEAGNLRAFGFLSSAVPFVPEAVAAPGAQQPPVQPPSPSQPGADETALWNAALELDTVGAYRAYLARYPNGFFAVDAQARVNAFENDPTAIARAAEEALGLNSTQRQQIQRSLSILEYDTRGIDGIFGTGTRNAIRGWQTSRGFTVTGYLDGPQVNALGQQAAVRAAELEEAARQAQEARDRADRAYWQVTGQGASESGLRAYLERYPDGLFAEQAEARIDEIERAARAEAEARDRAAWDVARTTDTVPALRAYLNDFPDGAFQQQAQARIDQLTGSGGGFTAQQIAQFEAREAALNLPPVTRSLIEQRLAVLGLEPGRVDGRFDDRTRRAIRRYQQARGLDVTGYLNQTAVVRLLAETVGGILQ